MINIRPASMDDALDILEWRNDPATRAMFRDGNVVSEASHIAWFASALARDDRRFFLGEFYGQKIGVMRFDRQDDGSWEVSHNMAPSSRGKGLGQRMVAAVLDQFEGKTIVAEIRQDNVACWHIYEKSGFKLTGTDDIYRHYSLDR